MSDRPRLPDSRGPEIMARLRERLRLVLDAYADPEISTREIEEALPVLSDTRRRGGISRAGRYTKKPPLSRRERPAVARREV